MDTYTFEIHSPKYGTFTVTAPERFRAEIERYTWGVRRNPHRAKDRQFEVTTNVPQGNGKYKGLYLHRFVWDLAGRAPTRQIDHADGQPLNNDEDNLRAATNAENSRNQRRRKSNTSGAAGVTWRKRERQWHARIGVDGARLSLGYFDSIEAAQLARDIAAIKFHGTFAVLNSPPRNDVTPEEYRALVAEMAA